MSKPQNKLPPLELVHDSFNYEPRTGRLTYNQPRRLVNVGDSITSGTVKIPAGGPAYSVNRVIWYWMTGEDPGELIVDHRNGDHNDNRWENLRLATESQNQWNKLYKGELPTGVVFKGDAKRAKPWAVRFRWHGTKFHFGSYATKEEAIEVANRERAKLHGQFSSHVSRT